MQNHLNCNPQFPVKSRVATARSLPPPRNPSPDVTADPPSHPGSGFVRAKFNQSLAACCTQFPSQSGLDNHLRHRMINSEPSRNGGVAPSPATPSHPPAHPSNGRRRRRPGKGRKIDGITRHGQLGDLHGGRRSLLSFIV